MEIKIDTTITIVITALLVFLKLDGFITCHWLVIGIPFMIELLIDIIGSIIGFIISLRKRYDDI